MSVTNIGKRVVRVVGAAASSAAFPKVVAGLGVAISIVKLFAAINDFNSVNSKTGKIGFGLDDSNTDD